MILPYGAGGVPGRGEISMSSVSSRTPVDFLLRIENIGDKGHHQKQRNLHPKHARSSLLSGEALIKSVRAVSERFFVQSRYRKRRNTLCTRKGYAASVSQLALATAALYFPFSIPKSGRKRSAHSRRRFIQSFPYYSSANRALPFFFSHRYSRAHRIRFSPARQPMYPKKPSFHPGSAT